MLGGDFEIGQHRLGFRCIGFEATRQTRQGGNRFSRLRCRLRGCGNHGSLNFRLTAIVNGITDEFRRTDRQTYDGMTGTEAIDRFGAEVRCRQPQLGLGEFAVQHFQKSFFRMPADDDRAEVGEAAPDRLLSHDLRRVFQRPAVDGFDAWDQAFDDALRPLIIGRQQDERRF